MLKRWLSILIYFFLLAGKALAQEDTIAPQQTFLEKFLTDGTYGIAFNDLPGFIWAHSDKNKNVYGPGNTFELQFIKKTLGKSPWEIKYKLPRVSVSLLYTDFGKPQLTGKAWSIIPQMEFAIVRKKNAELNFKLGAGLGILPSTMMHRTITRTTPSGRLSTWHFKACSCITTVCTKTLN
jgi:hypothetical protein